MSRLVRNIDVHFAAEAERESPFCNGLECFSPSLRFTVKADVLAAVGGLKRMAEGVTLPRQGGGYCAFARVVCWYGLWHPNIFHRLITIFVHWFAFLDENLVVVVSRWRYFLPVDLLQLLATLICPTHDTLFHYLACSCHSKLSPSSGGDPGLQWYLSITATPWRNSAKVKLI